MDRVKIYLAGKMSGLTFEEMNSWRKEFKELMNPNCFPCGMKEAYVVNPVDFYNFENKRHQSEEEVEEYDLKHVITSDLVVVNLDGLETSDGTKFELHDANYHYRIPVIAFGDRKLYDELHPWVKSKITRVEKDIYDAIDYIRDFYLRE